MDIYILRDGNQIGPFSEETINQMLKQGVVLINDPAWRPGMPEWIPLHSVLYPAPAPATPAPPPPSEEAAPAEVSAEPATGKQKAFLTYLGIAFPSDLSKEQAALLVNDAMEDPKNAARVSRWNDERLKLHPDLFAAELQAKKEERPQRFYELCQTEGTEALAGVTKAHCQVLVGYLDVKFPNWDSGRENEAAWNYFFPAVAEKFPQLVRDEWKDKLIYPQGPKVAPELKRRTAPAASKHKTSASRKTSSPVASLFKGLVFGLLLVALGVGGLYAYRHPEVVTQAKAQLAALQEKFSKKKTPASNPTPSAAPAQTQDSQPLFSDTDPKATTQGAPSSESTTMAPAPAAPADASMAGTSSTDSGMAGSDPSPELPVASSSSTPNNANTSLFDPVPSMANDPAAGTALPAAKTTVTLMQPVELQLTYGKIKVPAGTQLPIVEQDGTNLKVKFQNQVVAVPVSATDLGESGLPQ